MAFPWSDPSCSNIPSSPIPAPLNAYRSRPDRRAICPSSPTPTPGRDCQDEPPITHLPTPSITSEPDRFILTPQLRSSFRHQRKHRLRNRSRSSSIRSSTKKRSYRQATLSECLNRLTSSSVSSRTFIEPRETFDDELTDSNPTLDSDLMSDPHQDDYHHQFEQRPRLLPLVFTNLNYRQPKRFRIVDSRDNLSNTLLLSSSSGLDQPINLASTDDDRRSELSIRFDHHHSSPSSPSPSPSSSSSSPPPPPTRSRIIQESYDLLDFELVHNKRLDSNLAKRNRGMMKRIESLTSDPNTQTIQMWNPEFDNGYDFPFSLSFNHAAKAGDCGRPPSQGELMAVASALGTISLYHPHLVGAPEDLLPIASIQATRNGIFALSFSPSDLMLATGSGAQVSEIFDVETSELLAKLQDHSGTVKTLEFSPHDERIIVTGSRDGSIKVWDLRTIGRQADDDEVNGYAPVMTIRNAHDEKYTGRKRKKGVHIPSVSSVLWSRHTNHQIFSGGSVNSVVKLWDIRKKTPFSHKTHPSPIDQSVDHSSHDPFEEDHHHQRHHQYSSVRLNPQRPHGISSLACSSDGARIYSLGTDSTIRTHDGLNLSRTPESQLRSYQHPQFIGTSLYLKLTISEDNRYLGCSSSTGDIFIWDIEDGFQDLLSFARTDNDHQNSNQFSTNPVILKSAHSKEICGLDFWRQGLGSCSDDSFVKIWSYSDAFLSAV